MKSLEKHLLAASPYLGDPTFAGTVVLLLHHDQQGAFGVVLNRPVGAAVRQILEKAIDGARSIELPVCFGGPVSCRLMALHDDRSLAEIEAWPGLYVAAQTDHLAQLLKQSDRHYRLFLGCAQWGPGQLEGELKRGDWLVAPAHPQHLFSDDNNLWPQVLRQIGRSVIESALKIKHIPPDVTLN